MSGAFESDTQADWRSPASLRRAVLSQVPLRREWLVRSDLYGWYITLRIIGPFLGTVVLAPHLWIVAGPLTVVPVILMLGTYGYKISFIMHDCSHDSLFRTRVLNDRVGIVCGWLVGADYFQFKRVHRDHHEYNLTRRDPQFEEAGGLQLASRKNLVWHLSKALIGGRIGGYLSGYHGSVTEQIGPARPIFWMFPVVAIQAVIALFASGFGKLPVLALVYPLSAATIALFLARFRTFAEHVEPAGCALPDFVRTHSPNWVDQLFLYDAHFNYHFEHHLFPAIASCHLKSIHQVYAELIHGNVSLGHSMFLTVINRIRQASK